MILHSEMEVLERYYGLIPLLEGMGGFMELARLVGALMTRIYRA